jgi:hypothetical protein
MVLNGCGTTQIQEKTFYGMAPPNSVVVFHAISTATDEITMTQWQAMMLNPATPFACLSSADLAEFKKEEELLCSNSACSEAVQAHFKAFFQRADDAWLVKLGSKL